MKSNATLLVWMFYAFLWFLFLSFWIFWKKIFMRLWVGLQIHVWWSSPLQQTASWCLAWLAVRSSLPWIFSVFQTGHLVMEPLFCRWGCFKFDSWGMDCPHAYVPGTFWDTTVIQFEHSRNTFVGYVSWQWALHVLGWLEPHEPCRKHWRQKKLKRDWRLELYL